MRLCDLTDAYHETSGGIRTYLDEKVRFLRASTDWEHALIIPAARDVERQDGPTRVFGVASPLIPGCAPYRALLRTPRVMRLLEELAPDVLEIGNPYFQPWVARRSPARQAVVGFYHTDFPEAYVRPHLGASAARVAARYARFAHARLDLTVTASPALARKLSAWNVPRVELVPLGVDTRVFHPDRRDMGWRRGQGVADDDVLLIFAGRLDREKRVDVLLETTRHLPDRFPWKLFFLGDGPHAPLVERWSARDPRIHRLPFVRDRERVAAALASADLYVSAARFETFGLSVLEAQASGLPVIGQRAGAMVERVPSETGVLVEDLDPVKMAEAVASLDAVRRARMGRAARARVEAEHGWERTFTRLFALYEDACARRGRRAVAVPAA